MTQKSDQPQPFRQTFGMMNLEGFVIYLVRTYGQEHEETIRSDVQSFMLSRLATRECFDIGEVESKYPTLARWLGGPITSNKDRSQP